MAAVPGVGKAGKIPGPPELRLPEAFRRRCRRQPASVEMQEEEELPGLGDSLWRMRAAQAFVFRPRKY